MADGEDIQSPKSINTEDDMATVTVKLEIPNFTVKKKFMGKAVPKPGESQADVNFKSMGFEFQASITKKGVTTKYHYKVNKLPGEIDIDNCQTKYKEGLVTLILAKKEESSWAVMLSKNGLDQAPDE
ncbi:uncharacterized protein LOC127870176 [Dreissena polymorpha]|uniref:CS domain-containing protein n=1 Tax=Dreissena polymorpha TaxID=45954 RepID=A0A9D4RPT6_DREPO|nr:uncharacterized protein LOC127870176 [Dreissena polymorpha]KAH3876946.1 hypothetical protein DPMN_000799 [Dreissena polymorpha]